MTLQECCCYREDIEAPKMQWLTYYEGRDTSRHLLRLREANSVLAEVVYGVVLAEEDIAY